METVVGTVERINKTERNTKYGMKMAYGLKVDGTWYNNGFKHPNVSEGDTVKISYEESRYGKEIKSIEKTTAASNNASTKANTGSYKRGGSFPIADDDYQVSIIRQNCVGNAREIALNKLPKSASVEDVVETTLKVAKILEAYCTGKMDITDMENLIDNTVSEEGDA